MTTDPPAPQWRGPTTHLHPADLAELATTAGRPDLADLPLPVTMTPVGRVRTGRDVPADVIGLIPADGRVLWLWIGPLTERPGGWARPVVLTEYDLTDPAVLVRIEALAHHETVTPQQHAAEWARPRGRELRGFTRERLAGGLAAWVVAVDSLREHDDRPLPVPVVGWTFIPGPHERRAPRVAELLTREHPISEPLTAPPGIPRDAKSVTWTWHETRTMSHFVHLDLDMLRDALREVGDDERADEIDFERCDGRTVVSLLTDRDLVEAALPALQQWAKDGGCDDADRQLGTVTA